MLLKDPHLEFKPPQGPLGAVVGMFDGVHLGHRFLLDMLRRECSRRGISPAVFTFPQSPIVTIAPERAPHLLTTPEEKLARIAADGIPAGNIAFIRFTEEVRRMRASEFLRALHDRYNVAFLLRGFNNRFGTERDLTPEDYRRIAADCGIILVDAPAHSPIPAVDFLPREGLNPLPLCSSSIRNLLTDGDIADANRMLGYGYTLSGSVVQGKHLGRSLGFPTANIRPDNAAKLIPAGGVYICRTAISGDPHIYRAMVNIGRRPTVDGPDAPRTIEAHLLDFQGTLYGRTLTLEFIHRLRSEQRFASLDDLRTRLILDRDATSSYKYK